MKHAKKATITEIPTEANGYRLKCMETESKEVHDLTGWPWQGSYEAGTVGWVCYFSSGSKGGPCFTSSSKAAKHLDKVREMELLKSIAKVSKAVGGAP